MNGRYWEIWGKCSYTSPAGGWSGKLRVWPSVSCGTKGTGMIKWPSNTASMPEVRVKANPTALAANVDYHI